MKKKKFTTIVDIAKESGYSISTVSNALNNSKLVTEKTKEKILTVVKDLNYKPNDMARSLRMPQSKIIGVIVPDISVEFYSNVAKSFIEMASLQDYTVMLSSCNYNLKQEEMQLKIFIQKRVDAIVIVGGGSDEKILNEANQDGIPILLLDRKIDNFDISSVEFDNFSTMVEIVNMLCKSGYKRIAYFSEPATMTNLQDRYDGFIKGMELNGLKVIKEYLFIHSELQLDKRVNSYNIMKKLLVNYSRLDLPEVFITTADLVAAGMIGAAQEAEFDIPKDFGIIGFNNSVISEYITPSLTTVSQDQCEMGKAAWNVISSILNENIKVKRKIQLQQEIIIRNSCIL